MCEVEEGVGDCDVSGVWVCGVGERVLRVQVWVRVQMQVVQGPGEGRRGRSERNSRTRN